MDDSKPLISPDESRLRPASEWTSGDVDPAPAKLDESVAFERQGRSGQTKPSQNDFLDAPSVAVYYRNEEEVSDGFLIALRAMGIAAQASEPAKSPVARAKP
jgi:hypothetical protein